MATRNDNYSADEVNALVELYPEYIDKVDVDKNFLIIRVIDLLRVLDMLTPQDKGIVVLLGMFALPSRQVGDMLGLSHQTVLTKYPKIIESMVLYINGSELPES